MNLKIYLTVFGFFIALGVNPIAHSNANPLQSVSHVELAKYLGTWYEIASFPGPHQEGCTATQATYRLREDGDIEVLNECHDQTLDGKMEKC